MGTLEPWKLSSPPHAGDCVCVVVSTLPGVSVQWPLCCSQGAVSKLVGDVPPQHYGLGGGR